MVPAGGNDAEEGQKAANRTVMRTDDVPITIRSTAKSTQASPTAERAVLQLRKSSACKQRKTRSDRCKQLDCHQELCLGVDLSPKQRRF